MLLSFNQTQISLSSKRSHHRHCCHVCVFFSPFSGKLIPFLENVVGNASAVTILAISLERYRVACRTLTQSAASPTSMLKTCLFIWLTAVLAALPFVFFTRYTWSVFVDGTSVPVCKTPIDELWHKVRCQFNSIQNTLLSVAIITIKRKFFFAHTLSLIHI